MKLILCMLVLGALLPTFSCHHRHHRFVPSVVPPCDDGDHASDTGESHHEKPCEDKED